MSIRLPGTLPTICHCVPWKSKFSIIHAAPYDSFISTVVESGVRGIPILSTDIIDEFNPIYDAYPDWAYFSKDCNFTLNDRIKLSEVTTYKFGGFCSNFYQVTEDNIEKYPLVRVVKIPIQSEGISGTKTRELIQQDIEQCIDYFVPEEVITSIQDRQAIEEILTNN